MLIEYEVSGNVPKHEFLQGEEPQKARRSLTLNPADLAREDRELLSEYLRRAGDTRWEVVSPKTGTWLTVESPGIEGILAACRRIHEAQVKAQQDREAAIAQLPDEDFAQAYESLGHFRVKGLSLVPQDGAAYARAREAYQARKAREFAQKKQQEADALARQQAEAEASRARDAEKRAQIAALVQAYGDDNIQGRHAEGLLPEHEVFAMLRELVFAGLEGVAERYGKLRAGDVAHANECYGESEHVSFESPTDAETLDAEQYARLCAIRARLKDTTWPEGLEPTAEVVVTPRRHRAVCKSCDEAAIRYGAMVHVPIGHIVLTREYMLE
jgi:hypothetical protein